MALEGLHLFWKQILLGAYAAVMAARGALMVLRPRVVLQWMRKTVKRVVEWGFRLLGRTMPRLDHNHQVLVVRIMGMFSLVGASLLVWWLVRR